MTGRTLRVSVEKLEEIAKRVKNEGFEADLEKRDCFVRWTEKWFLRRDARFSGMGRRTRTS